MNTKFKKTRRRVIRVLALIFIIMNIIAWFHSYKFTHFSNNLSTKIKPEKLTVTQKAGIILFGINNPRPVTAQLPSQPFKNIRLKSNKIIECWSISTKNAKGTVALFHGYGGNKSQMIDRSNVFLKLGYNTLLVDFMGSGGSEGNQTTIGFFEAEEVKTAFDYLKAQGEKNIYLFCTSMGAAAILKAVNDYPVNPKAIITECPFGTMYKTVCARFKIMRVPAFPMAGLLVFWGGVQNGFWAFSHNPQEYAKGVHCPTLLLYGEKDNRVSREETDTIYKNLSCKKQLRTYPEAGHENYLKKDKDKWTADVTQFLGLY